MTDNQEIKTVKDVLIALANARLTLEDNVKVEPKSSESKPMFYIEWDDND